MLSCRREVGLINEFDLPVIFECFKKLNLETISEQVNEFPRPAEQ